MDLPPSALPGTALRILATTDLAAELVPRRVSWGEGGSCAGVVELLERERERQPTVWLDAGALGVIGLTHPHVHRLTQAPPPTDDWPGRVAPRARELRDQGARWVVAVLHDRADWWPNLKPGGPPTRARADRLAGVARPWAEAVDLIVGGHVPDGWVGELAGTPAGHAHVFADSVLGVDLPGQRGARALVRGWFRVPALRRGGRHQPRARWMRRRATSSGRAGTPG